MLKLSIALCTFNGVKHLREQLDSYSRQTRLPDELVVCDDGSDDGTLDLLSAFAATVRFPVIVHRNEKNLGYNENFLRCVGLCSGDVIALSDQDDVWFPEKLDMAFKIFLEDPAVTAVVHPLLCTNEELAPTGLVVPPMGKFGKLKHCEQDLFFTVNGMAIMFRAANVQPFLNRTRMLTKWTRGFAPFDEWILFLASIQGLTSHLRKPLSYYRRHATATTGDPAATFNAKFQFGLALKTGAEEYRYLAEVAKSRRLTAEQLMSEVSPSARTAIRSIPAFYSNVETYYSERAELYFPEAKSPRMRKLFGLWAAGGYKSRNSGGLGWKAFAKDLYMATAK